MIPMKTLKMNEDIFEITDGEARESLNFNKSATQGYILTATNTGNGTQWSPVGLPTDEQTAEAVSDWLDEHPEATTTVPDGSLTETKLSEALKLKAIKDYVTPQMYGAKADGTTDDSVAIQQAINSGKNVVFPEGTYKIGTTINIRKTYWNMDASNATITYTGSSYAFDISESWNLNLSFGVINAANGGCLHLHSSNTTDYVQYINIHFSQFKASTNCIYGHVTASGWVNEIRIHDGRFISGENGCLLFKDGSTDSMTHWNFYNIGIEGVTNGFFFNNSSQSRISDMVFVGCRYNESFVKLIKSVGLCQYFTFVGGGTVNSSTLDISAESDLWRFIAPSWTKHESLMVQNGKVVTCGYGFLTDGGIAIQKNDDLNDYHFPCNGYVGSNANAQTLSNCPTDQSFRMSVFSAAGLYTSNNVYNSLIQEIIPNDSTKFYRRRIFKNGTDTWEYSEWNEYAPAGVMSDVVDITVNNTKFSYRHNNKMVEWWVETNGDRYASQTGLGTLPAGIRPKKTLWESLSIWTNSSVTGSDRNALRITNTGAIQIIAPDAYQVGHGIYLL